MLSSLIWYIWLQQFSSYKIMNEINDTVRLFFLVCEASRLLIKLESQGFLEFYLLRIEILVTKSTSFLAIMYKEINHNWTGLYKKIIITYMVVWYLLWVRVCLDKQSHVLRESVCNHDAQFILLFHTFFCNWEFNVCYLYNNHLFSTDLSLCH